METEIRIVMADDHPIVRQGLRQMIEADKSMTVVAEAGDGQTALELIVQHNPDVAVLDIDMPKMDGFAVVHMLQQKNLTVEIIFLTMYCEVEMFQAAVDLGVKGYVLKDSAVTDIISSIKAVAQGRPYISSELSMLLLNRRRRVEDLEREQPGLNNLSPTERKILKLITEDKTSKEIAAQLFISHRTVETHRSNICKKLDLRGNLALVKFALMHKSEI